MFGKEEKEEVPEEKVQQEKAPVVNSKEATNEATFLLGDEHEIKGLKFVVSKITGLEVTLKRKDFL